MRRRFFDPLLRMSLGIALRCGIVVFREIGIGLKGLGRFIHELGVRPEHLAIRLAFKLVSLLNDSESR